MSTAMLNIRVVQPRMMSQKEAADYVRLPMKKFLALCPVCPVVMPGNVELYDVRDLDCWIDQLKAGAFDSDDEILGKLG